MARQLLVLLAVFANLLSYSNAEDWPRFRGPNGSGRSEDADNLPTKWSAEESVAWKTPILRGSSSPIVVKDRIFITAYSGYAIDSKEMGQRNKLRLHVLAFDFNSGEQVWDYHMPASEQEQGATKRIQDHGYASPTPCSDGERVFATFGPSGVVALDFDGNLLWKQDVGEGKAGFGAASSPIEFEDWVIVNASIESETLFGLDKKNGDIRWQVRGVERAWTTPALVTLADGRVELVIHFKNKVLGIDPRSGNEIWNCEGIPDYIVPTPVVVNEMVYFSGGRQNRTLAIRAGGEGDITTYKLWQVKSRCERDFATVSRRASVLVTRQSLCTSYGRRIGRDDISGEIQEIVTGYMRP